MHYLNLKNVTLDMPVRRGISLFKSSLKKNTAEKRTCKIRVLDGVSCFLSDGDRVALVGLNGAGKSTLLRVMAKAYPVDSGLVESKGSVFTLFGKNIGINRELSGINNIMLRGLFLGLSYKKVEEFLPQILEFSELGEDANRPVKGYSEGMVARLSFSMLLFVRSDILLIDEGLGAGDASFIKKAREVSDELLGRARIVVMASHSEELLKRFCSKAIWLDQGRVKLSGDIDSVLSEYKKGINSGVVSRMRPEKVVDR